MTVLRPQGQDVQARSATRTAAGAAKPK